jgi:hypothetical protein
MARRRHHTDFETIEIEYKGHNLTFREMDDEWSCSALKLKSKSLTALKRKLDKLDGETRRVSVAAIRVGESSYYDKLGTPVQIVMLAKNADWELKRYDEDREQKFFATNGAERRVPTVWIMVADGNQMERKKVRLDSLAFPSESTEAAIREHQRLGAEIKKLEAERESIIKAIPRLTFDDLTPKGVREENLDYDL